MAAKKKRPNYQGVGPRFRRAREMTPLTQEEVADAAGTKRQNIGKFEKGERGLYTHVFIAALRKLGNAGVNVDYVIMNRGPELVSAFRRGDPESLARLESRVERLERSRAETSVSSDGSADGAPRTRKKSRRK